MALCVTLPRWSDFCQGVGVLLPSCGLQFTPQTKHSLSHQGLSSSVPITFIASMLRGVLTCTSVEKNLSNVLPAPLYSVFQCFKSLGQIKEKTGLHVKVANVWVH